MNNKAIIDMISYYKDEPMVQHTLKVFDCRGRGH